jgi:lipoprotein-releasing system permease protein
VKSSVVSFIAMRYLRVRRGTGGLATSLLSVLGVAVGVMTLTVVLGVMNGFQLGFIENIVEISSYHLQIHGPPGSTAVLPEQVIAAVKSIPAVTAVVPFSELQVLVEGVYSKPQPCVIRAVPADLFSVDPVQARLLSIRSGSFSVEGEGSIVIGSELAASTGARVGDSVFLVTMDTTRALPSARREGFTVTGIFTCGYLDFDAGLGFISRQSAARLTANRVSTVYGVKLSDRLLDGPALKRISALLPGSGFQAESWRRYNRSFFDALFMEKLMIMLLVCLIFIVVGFNIYNSLRRTVFEKKEEIAVLKAVGVPPRSIQYAFIFEGGVVGFAGALSGMIFGLALASNINSVFSIIEGAVNEILWVGRAVAAPLLSGSTSEGFSIFSPLYFYLTEVPSRVLLPEAFLVASFAILASVTAAYGASRLVASFRPSEILRYE